MFKTWKSLILPVLAAIFLGSAAQGALYQWSRTAATNATADPTINWSEGMSPSSVNDSARAMMARTAEWRDDLSGLLTTAGTSTAYTVTTNQVLPATPTDGQALSFTVHTDSGLAPTLRADGGTIYPIHSAAGTAIGAGVLISGAPYTVKFKLASTAWVLHGFYGQPFVVPIGGMIDYLGTTSPNSNFVLPVGQCLSRTTYSVFFALVGTRYGVCDGSTTFAMPDFRGTIAATLDNMAGVPRNLLTTSCNGTIMGNQCGAQNITLALGNLPSVAMAGTTSGALSGSGSISGDTVNVSGSVQIPNSSNTTVQSGTGATISQFAGNTSSQPVSIGQGTVSGTASITTSGSLDVSVTLGGSSTAVNTLPPLQIVTKLLRIF